MSWETSFCALFLLFLYLFHIVFWHIGEEIDLFLDELHNIVRVITLDDDFVLSLWVLSHGRASSKTLSEELCRLL